VAIEVGDCDEAERCESLDPVWQIDEDALHRGTFSPENDVTSRN